MQTIQKGAGRHTANLPQRIFMEIKLVKTDKVLRIMPDNIVLSIDNL